MTLVEAAGRRDVVLDTAALVPIARWVTPAAYPRRFDTRFFAAELPAGAEATFVGGEVADHRWTRPGDALAAMASGEIGMWVPTSSVLQRLSTVRSFGEIRARLACGPAAPIRSRHLAERRWLVTGSSAGGVPGRAVETLLVGRVELTVVDPGDPSPEALAALLGAAGQMGGRIAAIALTSPEPDRSAGADELSERTGAPIVGPPGSARLLPFPVIDLGDGAVVPAGDARLRLRLMPGDRPTATYVGPRGGPVRGAAGMRTGPLQGAAGMRIGR
jgi:hypothetical protein